ncbi:MAG: hypothetical protein LBK95_16080 [Bifidobacteriaceae bacterium]|nr:hypothetical protein [Bifidobacteriaceae bacterium]
MNRVLQVSRLYLLERTNYLTVPALVLSSAAVLSYAIGAVTAAATGEQNVMTGGFQAPLWALFGATLALVAGMYPFSFALGLGRRVYFLGTAVFFTAFSLAFAAICTVFGVLESVTDGFGSHARFFAMPIGAENAWAGQFMGFFGLVALALGAAFWIACCFRRWRARGLLATGGAMFVLVAAFSTAATVFSWWDGIWGFLTGLTSVQLGACLAALAVVAMATAWPVLRRAAP